MDGFEENSGVVVMAATNLPELLDSALTRPGRFDRTVRVHKRRTRSARSHAVKAAHSACCILTFCWQRVWPGLRLAAPRCTRHCVPVSPQVAVSLPDVRGRQHILDLYLGGKPLAPDVDTGELRCWDRAGLRDGRGAGGPLLLVLTPLLLQTSKLELARLFRTRVSTPVSPPPPPLLGFLQTSWRGAPPASAALSWQTW